MFTAGCKINGNAAEEHLALMQAGPIMSKGRRQLQLTKQTSDAHFTLSMTLRLQAGRCRAKPEAVDLSVSQVNFFGFT